MELYIVETILMMVGAIGALLIGFDLLSTNITKLFHSQLKGLFNKTSKNNLIGVGIGAASTAIVQSSGATTVMVVGFVNTGIITLKQATALIMGANIGTTITAQLAALSSFDFGAFALGLTGVGTFVTMLSKKDRTKTIGNALAGFGLLFLGLECMSLAIANTYEGEELVKIFIKNILSSEIVSSGAAAPFLLFVIGIVVTALVQSSSLFSTLIIALVAEEIYIGAGDANCLTNNVLFLILGTNIGSCVTAFISSIGTSSNARRASIIHILFNTLGSLVFMILLFAWPKFMEQTFGSWFDKEATQIAMFHTFFNVLSTLLFLPFINVFVKISKLIIKDKEVEDDGLVYVDERLFATPSVAVHQVRKELGLMYSKSVTLLNKSIEGFLNKDPELRPEIDAEIDKLESTNKLVIEFMVKLTNQNLAYEDECTISAFHRTLNDILRIGEIADNICKYTKQTVNNGLEFSPNVMLNIGFMKNKINDLYDKTDEVFLTKNLTKLPEADVIEEEIDIMRKQLIDDHLERLNRNECHPQNNAVYVNLVNNLERAADHMIYIAYSVKEAKEQAKHQ